MIVGLINSFFKLCGVAPPGKCSSYLYSIVPLAFICTHIVFIVTLDLPAKILIPHVAGTYILIIGELQFLLMNVFYPKKFQSIQSGLECVDKEFEQIGVSIESFTLSKKTILLLITQLTDIALQIHLKESLINTGAWINYTVFCNVGWHQHMVFAGLLHRRFLALNLQLTRIVATADNTLVQIVGTRLDTVFRIHSALHVIISDINSHFCLYNLCFMGSRFLTIVFVLYETLQVITHFGDNMNLRHIHFIFIHFVLIVNQIVECHLCAKEANRTVEITHRILKKNSPNLLWEKIGLFSRLSLDNKVEFTVGGIFSFDMKLFTKISTMAFSYLVIALQLKDVHLFRPVLSNNTSGNST